MTESWNAVLLIDECDVFLEQRQSGNVETNALVSIFLRLLERHKGVMFLTTNRINCLDPAFESRISVVVRYDSLDQNARLKVWTNLLSAANIATLSQPDIDFLSTHAVNGRQIKNAIRMSQALACDLDEELNVGHFLTVLENVSFIKM
jgi:SpoVK/Ycf46/Vps4 family AAA+-type ATPase